MLLDSSYRYAFLFDLVYGSLNLVIYYFISRTFGHPSAGLGAAPTYFSFVAVGVTITTVIQGASVGLARRVRNEQLTGTLEALVAQPLTATELAVGLAAFPVLFAILRGGLYIVIANVWLGLGLTHPQWAAFFLMLLVSGGMVAAVGIALAALVVVFKRAEAPAAFVTFALGFFGGAFFPISVLPGWAHRVGNVTPTRFAFDGARAALFYGHGATGDVLTVLAIGVLATPLAILAFAAAVRLSIRQGTLASY